MESTPGEVSNYILHDAECELYQKLLAEDFLPGTRSTGRLSIWKTQHFYVIHLYIYIYIVCIYI